MKKYYKKIIGILIIFLFSQMSNTLNAQSYGIWQGNATQYNNNQTWSVILNLDSQRGGTISFPSLGCGGTVTYISGQRGGSYIYSENLNYGTDKCMQGLSIRFSMVNNTTMNWEEIDSEGTTVAQGILTREAPPAVNIVIKRKEKAEINGNNICTQGELFVNGAPFCFTLELPFENNNNNFSSIAVGNYAALMGRTNKHSEGVIQLKNVNSIIYYNDNGIWKKGQIKRGAGGPVEIHAGNKPEDSKGCILVGSSYSSACFITNSKNTLKKLYNDYFDTDAKGIPNSDITVTVSIQLDYN